MVQKIVILVSFVLVLALPFALRGPGRGAGSNVTGDPGGTVIIVTPHVEQIRYEYARAFDRWHRATYGAGARIDWRAPGGTSEIVKQLEAQFTAAAKSGRFTLDGDEAVCEPGTIGYDIFFGGGSYEHDRVRRGLTVPIDGRDVNMPMSVPAVIDDATLEALIGENTIGSQRLYHPDKYWIGTALSGFGIVYNRRVYEDLGVEAPEAFRDLADPRLANLIALADPRLSGSVTTTYESILNKEGWDEGWRTLREMSANARYFASASTRPPVDVSQGEAAAGLAIDFYGRGQAQAVMREGETAETSRVGYVNPRGAVYIDADPVTILRGGPNPELANRFVEFVLTDEAQVIWQLPARDNPASEGNPPYAHTPDERMGPLLYELRRMPIRRDVYARYGGLFIDPEDPFVLAAELPRRGWRSSIAPMMAAFAIDSASELRAAWAALNRARSDPSFPPETLAEMESLFYAMPDHEMEDGTMLTFSEASYGAIKSDTGSWTHPTRGHRATIRYTAFFRSNYERVNELERAAR